MTGVAPELLARHGLTPSDFQKELAVLTHKERQILTLLCKGYGPKDVSDLVRLSIHTVYTHRDSGLQQLQCTLIECAVTMAKAGWI